MWVLAGGTTIRQSMAGGESEGTFVQNPTVATMTLRPASANMSACETSRCDAGVPVCVRKRVRVHLRGRRCGGARKPTAKVCVSFLSHLLNRQHPPSHPLSRCTTTRSSLGLSLSLSSAHYGIDAGMAAYALCSLLVSILLLLLTPAHELLVLLTATAPTVLFRGAATDAASFLLFLCCCTRSLYASVITSPPPSSAYPDIISDAAPSLASQANGPPCSHDSAPASLVSLFLEEKAAADSQGQCNSFSRLCLFPPKTTTSGCARSLVHSLLHPRLLRLPHVRQPFEPYLGAQRSEEAEETGGTYTRVAY